MPYNLVEAGAAAGKSRSTILRAIRRGVLSATRDEASGGWLIEPAELHRVYSPVAPNGHDRVTDRATDQTRNRDDRLDGELRELRARLADAHATIDDLRRQRDAEAEERRRLTMVITDMRGEPTSASAAPSMSRRWWPWSRR